MTLKEHLQIDKRSFQLLLLLSRKFMIYQGLENILTSITGYIPIYFSAKLLDALAARQPLPVIIRYVALTVGLVFAVKLLTSWTTCVRDAHENIMYDNQDWTYSQKAMEMAFADIENPEILRQKVRIRREAKTGFNLYRTRYCLNQIIANGVKVIASLALTASFFAMPSLSVWYKLALVLGLVVTILVSIKFTAKSAQLDKDFYASYIDTQLRNERFYNYIGDYSSGKDIRLYAMENHLADSKLSISKTLNRIINKNACRQALWAMPTQLMKAIIQFGLYGILIVSAMSGGISVGDIAKYVACIMLLIEAITNIVVWVQMNFDNHSYLKRYFDYLDIPNQMYKGTLTVEKRDDNEYYVEFKDVSFRYPNTESYALRHINLKFKVGEKLAVVGQNGSGKTTFIKLLCRLYDPTEGEILLNGVNIQKYDYDEYMSIFAVVFQDFRLFPFKLGEVVASSKRYNAQKVTECLEKANFGSWLSSFPEGLNSYLYKSYDKTGIEISGGEAQKIALARALYKDSPFILLDEPTAALDPVSEYEVYKNFNSISGDRTAVYISHRLASCRFCDKIAVFDNGQIIQTGSHDTLFADTSGKYHQLWNAQAQYYNSPQQAT